jgi:hypothetical protein
LLSSEPFLAKGEVLFIPSFYQFNDMGTQWVA